MLDNPELVDLLLPMVRADFRAVDTDEFIPETPLSCPIFAYGGINDTETPAPDLARWDSQTTDTFAMRLLPGNHFLIHSAAVVLTQNLARDFRVVLESR